MMMEGCTERQGRSTLTLYLQVSGPIPQGWGPWPWAALRDVDIHTVLEFTDLVWDGGGYLNRRTKRLRTETHRAFGY